MASRAKAEGGCYWGPRTLREAARAGGWITGASGARPHEAEAAMVGATSNLAENDLRKQAQNRVDDLRALRDQMQVDGVTLVSLQPGKPGENVLAALAVRDVITLSMSPLWFPV